MRPLSIVILIIAVLTACESDDFYNVTKVVEAPNEVQFDQPFTFRLKLINRTESVLPLTLDKDIAKSIQFLPTWFCGDDFLHSKTPNPKRQNHNLYTVNLTPGDSLTFQLTAQMKTYSNNDSLLFTIEGYEKVFRLANPNCENFYLDFMGKWLPGNGPFADSMEGYNFRTKIKLPPTTE